MKEDQQRRQQLVRIRADLSGESGAHFLRVRRKVSESPTMKVLGYDVPLSYALPPQMTS
jgi:hypothetical protein